MFLAKFPISISYVWLQNYSEGLSKLKTELLKPWSDKLTSVPTLSRRLGFSKRRTEIDFSRGQGAADRTGFAYFLRDCLELGVLDAGNFGVREKIDPIDLEARVILS